MAFIFQIFPDGHITPGVMVANTDTKHYLHLTNNVYRQNQNQSEWVKGFSGFKS